MKIFYDETGAVVGTFEGSTTKVESGVKIPGTKEISTTRELEKALSDNNDPITIYNLRVEGDEIVPFIAVEANEDIVEGS